MYSELANDLQQRAELSFFLTSAVLAISDVAVTSFVLKAMYDDLQETKHSLKLHAENVKESWCAYAAHMYHECKLCETEHGTTGSMRLEQRRMRFNRTSTDIRLVMSRHRHVLRLVVCLAVCSQDCVPKLKFCVASIEAFDQRLRAQDACLVLVSNLNTSHVICTMFPHLLVCRMMLSSVWMRFFWTRPFCRCQHESRRACESQAGKYDIVIINSRIEQCLQKAG